MKDFAKKYLDWYNGLSKGVKILLCLLWDIPSNLARLSQSALEDNTLGVALSVVLAIFGGWVLCVVDIVTLALNGKLIWLDDLKLESNDAADDSADAPAEAPAEDAKDGDVE